MSETNVFYIPGPMHPDLFDGETPIMTPVTVGKDVKAYRVTLTFSGECSEVILARDEDEAKEVFDELGFSVGDADDVFLHAHEASDAKITPDMVRHWRQRNGEEAA